MSKEEFIAYNKKVREAKENATAESRKLEKFYDSVKMKENLVKFGRFDSAKVYFENINLLP